MFDDPGTPTLPAPRHLPSRLPPPVWINVAALMLLVAGLGFQILLPAFRHTLAIRHLREHGVDIESDSSRVGPEWLRRLVGKACLEPFGHVQNLDLSGLNVTDDDLAYVKHLRGLEWLAVNRNPISDAGIGQLAEISTLKALRLEHTRVTDAGLAPLAELRRLEVLSVERTRVTGTGLTHLKGLPRLRHLDLEGNQLDDAILADLSAMTGLRELRLGRTNVSPAGIAALERTLGITIVRTNELLDQFNREQFDR